ncbi:MAG: ABC transporter ATP-binding protein/permease [Clostridiales bacterium]|nr:ABC transporter ATP-binding protein/permease [Clostridiales bacterium]
MFNKRLFGLGAPERVYLVGNVLCQWVAMLLNAVLMFRLGWLFERMWTGAATSGDLWQTLAVFAVVIVVRVATTRLGAVCSFRASTGVKNRLRHNLYEKLLALGPGYTEQVSTAEAVQVASEGVDQLETYFGAYLPQLFYCVLAPVTLFVLLAPVSLATAVVLLVCVPLIPLSIMAVQKFAKRLLGKYWGIYASLGDCFLENVQGLTTLKIYGADARYHKRMNEEAERFRVITMKVLTMQLNSIIVMDTVAYGGAALGTILAVAGLQNGSVSLAGAFAIVLLAAEFFLPMRALGGYFHVAMNGIAASEKMFRILDLPVPADGTEDLPKGPITVEAAHLNFAYDPARPILKDVALQALPGGICALVGESGCGKSTIAGLLAGRLRGYTGSIRLNGVELREIRSAQLRRRVTLVSDKGYLFRGTVEDNLRMGKPDATEQELADALRQVLLYDFFAAQQGLKTPISERGANLSGGQCQRLNLARALLRGSDLYLFDEVTSNIDAESENAIMDVIRRLSERCTVVLISHRLANVTDARGICMMARGEITEQGTHDALLAQNGGYCALYTQQRALEQYSSQHKKEEAMV